MKDSLDSGDSRELKGGWGGGERELSPLSLFHNLGFALDESEFEPSRLRWLHLFTTDFA
jgi:hypothetical protein